MTGALEAPASWVSRPLTRAGSAVWRALFPLHEAAELQAWLASAASTAAAALTSGAGLTLLQPPLVPNLESKHVPLFTFLPFRGVFISIFG